MRKKGPSTTQMLKNITGTLQFHMAQLKTNKILHHYFFRLTNQTGGGPMPDVQFPDPDPDIFREYMFIYIQNVIFLLFLSAQILRRSISQMLI